MRIRQNKAIELKTPRFLVDKALNPDIERYEVLSHLNRSSASAFVGTSGSGKTSLMVSLLMNKEPKIWKKQFNWIIVVMPRASRASLKSNIFDKYLDESCLFDSLTDENVDMIVAMIEQNAEQGQQTLLILDDVASALKSAHVTKQLQHLVYAYRHFRLVVVMLVQTLRTIPLSIRKNLSNLIVFHKPRISEWEAITHEFLEMEKDQAKELYAMIFKQKYDWSLINLGSGKVYSKFDEVMIREDT
jgi:hypothetical protein